MSHAQRSKTILSAEDYLNYDDDTDNRYELLNGRLIEMPPESNLNARIASFLFAQFLQFGCHF